MQGLNTSNYLDHNDWRLPTRNELQTLIDYGRYGPATTFPKTVGWYYWSSTTYALGTDDAWGMNFYTGNVDYSYTSDHAYVRAVRGGPCRSNGDWCIDDSDCLEGDECINGACVPG